MNTPRKFLYFLPIVAAFFLTVTPPIHAEEKAVSTAEFAYDIIAGEWQRADADYIINISNVQADGQVMVEYFNPRSIHIDQSIISTQNKLITLFVRFQDKGYEGSTYTLFYYAEKDALVGFYYQAVVDQTYEVIFSRKNGEKE